MEEGKEFYRRLSEKGVSRRDFMKYCGMLTATMGLSSAFIPRVAEVFAAPKQRPPVIWLQFAECTGCTEAVLGSMYPWIDELVLEILSMEYHETIMAAAGHQAEENLRSAVNRYRGKFICVVEGAVATRYGGAYGKIGGRTFLEIANDVCRKAAAVICLGTCSSYGGLQAAAPNPGGYKGIGAALKIKTVNIPGCPPNPVNLVGTIVNYLLLGKLPALDKVGRPFLLTEKAFTTSVPGGHIMKTMSSSSPSARKRPGWATAFSRWAARARRPITTARSPNSMTGPVSPSRPDIPASGAASPISGTRCPHSSCRANRAAPSELNSHKKERRRHGQKNYD